MMRLLNALLLTLSFMAIPLTSHAGLIGTTGSISFDYWGPNPQPDTLLVKLAYTPGYDIFENEIVTASSVGDVFTATAIGDPDFTNHVAMLTNGVADKVWLRGGDGLRSMPEAVLYSLGSNDFAGFTIDKMTLTIDEVTFTNTGPTTYTHIAYTVRVYGEPALPVGAKTWGAIKALYR
jgi:hypothetical protein